MLAVHLGGRAPIDRTCPGNAQVFANCAQEIACQVIFYLISEKIR